MGEACAIDASHVFAWGANNGGQLGLGDDQDRHSPVHVAALQGYQIQSLACGAGHVLMLTHGFEVFSWGWGRYGVLGHGDELPRHEPTRIDSLSDCRIVSISAGWQHNLAVSSRGGLFTWGQGEHGQLAHGDFQNRAAPAQVEFASESRAITAVAAGMRHSLALADGGMVYAWGEARHGRLGLGAIEASASQQRTRPPAVPLATHVPTANAIVQVIFGLYLGMYV